MFQDRYYQNNRCYGQTTGLGPHPLLDISLEAFGPWLLKMGRWIFGLICYVYNAEILNILIWEEAPLIFEKICWGLHSNFLTIIFPHTYSKETRNFNCDQMYWYIIIMNLICPEQGSVLQGKACGIAYAVLKVVCILPKTWACVYV